MRLPRDIGGQELANLLSQRYGYQVSRQTGGHLRLSSVIKGTEHHITIPKHKPLRVGTLNRIVSDVALRLELEKGAVIKELFGD